MATFRVPKVDSSGHVLHGDGTPLPSAEETVEMITTGVNAAPAIVAAQAGTAIAGVACYGDSMTFGINVAASAKYVNVLGTLIPVPVANYGVSGQLSSEIALRNGGLDLFITVAGGIIPASTAAVTVTVLPDGIWRSASSWNFSGSLAGVSGTLSKNNAAPNVWTFTRSSAGDAVPVPAETLFVSAQKSRAQVGRIIWAGRNNTALPRPAIDVSAMANDARKVGSPYIVLPIFNAQDEPSGSAGYVEVMATNAEYAKDPNYYDLRGYIIRNGLTDAGITPTAADTTAIGQDRIPPSLMLDNLHLNAAGQTVVGKRLAAVTAQKGWYSAPPTAAPVTPPVVALPGFADSFNRADNPSALGSTDDGKPWNVIDNATQYSIWEVAGNAAKYKLGAARSIAYVDALTSNGTARAVIGTLGDARLALAFRVVDINNYLAVTFRSGAGNNRLQLLKRVGGAVTSLGYSPAGAVSAAGSDIEVVQDGTSVSVKLNGAVVIGPVTITEFVTETRVGFVGESADYTGTVDLVSVTPA